MFVMSRFLVNVTVRSGSSLPASLFLLLLVLFAVRLVSCLGGQGAHGIADGLVVGVDTWQVL